MTTPTLVEQWLRFYPGHHGTDADGFLVARDSRGRIISETLKLAFEDCALWLNDGSRGRTDPTPGSSTTPTAKLASSTVVNATTGSILRLVIIKTKSLAEEMYTASSPIAPEAAWLRNLHETTSLPLVGLAALCKGTTRFEARHHATDSGKESLRSSSDFFVSMGTLEITWTYSRITQRVRGIIVNRDDSIENINLISLFKKYLLLMQEPLALGFCISQWRIENFGAGRYGMEGLSRSIRQVEDETGELPYGQAQGNAFTNENLLHQNKELLQRLNEANRTILEIVHKLGNNRHCLEFLVRANNRLLSLSRQENHYGREWPQQSPMTEKLNTLHDTMNIFMAEIDWCKDRIATQVSVINQVISARDTSLSIQIARDTRRDGSSMITLAVVTLLFLPGTFVASFFAMPLFNWDAPNEVGLVIYKDKFWVYWTVAGSLTVFVLSLWTVWFYWRRGRDAREEMRSRVEIRTGV